VTPDTSQPTLGTLLRFYRRRLALTREALAEQAGFSVEYIKKLEGGSRRPSAPSLEILAHTLELDPAELASLRASRLASLTQAGSEAVARPAGSALGDQPSYRTFGDVGEGRRLITALFCDLISFPSVDAPPDPEDVRDVQRTYFAEVKALVERYGGMVEKYGGSTVLAVFGLATAHEDDPERALLCALEMQQTVPQAIHPAHVWAPPPSIRVGIETGEVVTESTSGYDWEDTAVSGHAINAASMLQSSAEPGQILVGQEAAHLTRSRIRYCEPRELSLRGSSSTTRVFQALGLDQSTERLWQTIHEILPPAPFVGREREIAVLEQLWQSCQAGRGELVSIVGEPGIGKSRLIAEFVSRVAADDDFRVLHARCFSYSQEVSLWLVADLLRSIFSLPEDDTLDGIGDRLDAAVPDLLSAEDEDRRLEARDVLGEVLGLPPSESLVSRAGAEIRRNALVRSLRLVLAALSDRSPTILVLQDLHWIDASSNDVLAKITVDVPGLPVLVVVAQREGWSGPWAEWSWPERLTLRPLLESEGAALAAEVLGRIHLSADLEQYLAQWAGGNPFFIEELGRRQECPSAWPIPSSLPSEHGKLGTRAVRSRISLRHWRWRGNWPMCSQPVREAARVRVRRTIMMANQSRRASVISELTG